MLSLLFWGKSHFLLLLQFHSRLQPSTSHVTDISLQQKSCLLITVPLFWTSFPSTEVCHPKISQTIQGICSQSNALLPQFAHTLNTSMQQNSSTKIIKFTKKMLLHAQLVSQVPKQPLSSCPSGTIIKITVIKVLHLVPNVPQLRLLYQLLGNKIANVTKIYLQIQLNSAGDQ